MFEPSTVFNDGDVDVNVVFAPCDNEDSAKEIANRYHRLLLHPDTREIFLLDEPGVASPITNETIICKVCTKELGKPIDCTTEEGKQKAIDTIMSMDPAYSVSEDDMKQILLDEMWAVVRPRANKQGFVVFDSIAYGVLEQ
jgi:hypothetical protein